MLELVIVRHGESVRNHASDLAHHGDTNLLEYQLRFDRDEAAWDLTQRGIDQAKCAGIWIRDNVCERFDTYYVSPFKRTRQTAACLELAEATWEVDARIRERDWGDYLSPGVPPYSVDQYLRDLSFCGEVCWKGDFPGSESIEDMLPRCRSFMDDFAQRQRTGCAVLVTHGGTMKSLELIIEGLSVDEASRLGDRHLTNCSVLHYHLEAVGDSNPKWIGSVRFASPTLPDMPVSAWQPLANASS